MTDELRSKIEKAESGDKIAMFNVGVLYFLQLEKTKSQEDLDNTIKWWTMAAENGVIEAARNFIFTVYSGTGLLPNDDECLKWIKHLAFDCDDPFGMMMLGGLFCGHRHSYLQNTNTFSDAYLKSIKNKTEGIRLVEIGISRMENSDTKPGYGEYFFLAGVYNYYNTVTQGGVEYKKIPDLEVAIDYLKKARQHKQDASDDIDAALQELEDGWIASLQSLKDMVYEAEERISKLSETLSQMQVSDCFSPETKEASAEAINYAISEFKKRIDWFQTKTISAEDDSKNILFPGELDENSARVQDEVVRIMAMVTNVIETDLIIPGLSSLDHAVASIERAFFAPDAAFSASKVEDSFRTAAASDYLSALLEKSSNDFARKLAEYKDEFIPSYARMLKDNEELLAKLLDEHKDMQLSPEVTEEINSIKTRIEKCRQHIPAIFDAINKVSNERGLPGIDNKKPEPIYSPPPVQRPTPTPQKPSAPVVKHVREATPVKQEAPMSTYEPISQTVSEPDTQEHRNPMYYLPLILHVIACIAAVIAFAAGFAAGMVVLI